MRSISFITFIMLLICGAPKAAIADLYPGLVHLDCFPKYPNDTVKFIFYKEPNTSQVTRQLSFYRDWKHNSILTRILETDYHDWFSPMSFDDDTTSGNFRIYLSCRDKVENWFQVVLNEKTGETGWIYKSHTTTFIPWNHLDRRKYTVTVQNNSNYYYEQPDTNSRRLPYNGFNCFELIQVQGDWMKVSNKNSEMCGNYDLPYLDKAWIHFKTSDRLLIHLDIM